MTATPRTVHYVSLELTKVAVIVCGRYGLATSLPFGRRGHVLWPSLIWPSWFVAVVV